MKLMRISRTKRRISASSMRAVERRRSRKLLGRADIMLLHWKPVDTWEEAGQAHLGTLSLSVQR